MAIAKELDEIYARIDARIDAMMHAGQIQEIDRILVAVPMDLTSIDLLLGYLTVTLPVRSKLPSRPSFYEATKTKLGLKYKMEAVEEVLQGLK